METKVQKKAPPKPLLITDIKRGQTFEEKGNGGVFIKTSNGAVGLNTGIEFMGSTWVWNELTLVECKTVVFTEVK